MKNKKRKSKKMLFFPLLLSSSITLSGCGESYEEKRANNIVESTFDSDAACKDIEAKVNGFYNDEMTNYIFYLYGSVYIENETFDENSLLYTYTYTDLFGKEKRSLSFTSDDSHDNEKCLGSLRDFIINNNIECDNYKFVSIDGAYIDFNQYWKDSIINNYGSEVWDYLQLNGILVPIFSYSDIKSCVENNEYNLENGQGEIESVSENSVSENGNLEINNSNNTEENIIEEDSVEESITEENKILEQELEIEFYEKDSTKISIKVNDDYQDVYSNYFLYSCGEELMISDQEDIVIVSENFKNNGIEGEVQLLGTLKDYILENEIKASEYRYVELSEENGQSILDTYGEETYNYYKEKGYPIICFDSKSLYETYRNSLKEDEPVFLQLK